MLNSYYAGARGSVVERVVRNDEVAGAIPAESIILEELRTGVLQDE
jgi:hypothetical protein